MSGWKTAKNGFRNINSLNHSAKKEQSLDIAGLFLFYFIGKAYVPSYEIKTLRGLCTDA